MKKIALSICLLALVLLAFTGCGLLETDFTIVNETNSELSVTVTCAGSSQTVTVSSGTSVTVKVMKEEQVRYSCTPARDTNGFSIYPTLTGSGPYTLTYKTRTAN